MSEENPQQKLPRRALLERLSQWAVVLLSSGIVLPYIFAPRKRNTDVLRIENPNARINPYLLTTIGNENIIVFKEGNQDEPKYTALSLRCTHADCTVRYEESGEKFVCPCHGGAFKKDGSVLQSPPRKPLQQVKILHADDGSIYLRMN